MAERRIAAMPTIDALTFAFAVDETDFEEMVSYPTNVTGVDNTIFISPKGNARHGPRIKVAINPPDRIDPRSETASVDFDGTIVSGDVPRNVLDQVRDFLAWNRGVLLDYWEYRIDTETLRQRLRKAD
jgi:hypothetical protein